MFETAELDQKVSKKVFKRREVELREALLTAQQQLKTADFPVIVLFAGVDGAGKGETANLLNAWMDPRFLRTRAFGPPSQEESERPRYWRFWRALPAAGHLGIMLSAWYSQPLMDRVHGGKASDLEVALDEIQEFETMLAADGALIIKFWMHLGRDAQRRRLKKLEGDANQSWRVTPLDWKHWRKYDEFISAAERIISHTSTGEAPWHIVEGADSRYRSLRVGEILLEALHERLARAASATASNGPAPVVISSAQDETSPAGHQEEEGTEGPAGSVRRTTVLDSLDLTRRVDAKNYDERLEKFQGQLNRLHRKARRAGISTLLVFEGADAAGKGGSIRRLVSALDASAVRVHPFAAPTDEERAHHYLWRFWRHLPRAGDVAIFDRSWYGRVLVERVEGFARPEEWRRAYSEINLFERELVEHGTVLVKYWVHIDAEEQLRRFQERENTPHKRWKLTDEDWRNRKRMPEYEIAVHDMVERTSTRAAPWTLVEGNDKRYARIKVIKTLCRRLEKALG